MKAIFESPETAQEIAFRLQANRDGCNEVEIHDGRAFELAAELLEASYCWEGDTCEVDEVTVCNQTTIWYRKPSVFLERDYQGVVVFDEMLFAFTPWGAEEATRQPQENSQPLNSYQRAAIDQWLWQDLRQRRKIRKQLEAHPEWGVEIGPDGPQVIRELAPLCKAKLASIVHLKGSD